MTIELQDIYNSFRRYARFRKNFEDLKSIDDYMGYGKNILHFSVMYGIKNYVIKCIESGADIHKPTEHGTYPVYIALVNNHLEVAEFLLQNGADPNVKVFGVHHFSWVIRTEYIPDRIDIFKLLIKYGLLLNQIDGYNDIKRLSGQQQIFLRRKIAHRKWIILKVLSRFLTLHQQAVVTANHPKRLKEYGYFKI